MSRTSGVRDASRWWGVLASRLVLLLLAGAYAAGPLLATLLASSVPTWLKGGLLALTALAAIRPAFAPAVLLAFVPLLPILPSLVTGVPPAIVHVVVLTQAVPVLVRAALDRRERGPAVFAVGWGVFVLVCAVSVGVELTPDRLRGAPLAQAWRDVAAQVPAYVFSGYTTRDVSALPRLLALADGLLCALIVHAAGDDWSWRRGVLRAAAVAAGVVALIGIVQAATGVGLQTAWQAYDPGITRINGTFVDPNALASYLAMIGPVTLGFAGIARGWTRGFWLTAFGVLLLALVMTAGRMGLVSLAAGCGLLAYLAHAPGAGARRAHAARRVLWRGLVVAGSLVAALALVGTVLNVSHHQQTSYVHTWLYTFNLRQPPDAVAKGRMAVWRAMGAMVADAPLFGVGLGMGINEFERYREALGLESIPAGARLSAHNTFLLVAGDLGLLGLAAFLLAIACTVVGAQSALQAHPRARDDLPTLGLCAGLAGLLLTMLTGDRIVLREDIVVVTTCAALVCMGAPRLRWPLRAALAGVVIVALASWPVRVQARALAAHGVPEPEGLHGRQSDGVQWTSGYLVLYLPIDTRSVTIPIANFSPGSQRVRMYLDGRLVEDRVLPHGGRVDLSYRMPQARQGSRWHRLTMEVDPTWRAPWDPRELGVQIGEWRVERWPSRPDADQEP